VLDTTYFFAAWIVRAKDSIQSGLAPVRAGGLTITGESSKLVVKHPWLQGDTVAWEYYGRKTVPLGRVAYAEVHQVDAMATGFFLLMTAAITTAFVVGSGEHARTAQGTSLRSTAAPAPTGVSTLSRRVA
jgi:hypothetical protein